MMSEATHNDSYRNALNTAFTELNQIAEEIASLYSRKGNLRVASEGLKALLATQELPSEAGQQPISSSFATETHVTEFPGSEGVSTEENRTAKIFRSTVLDSTDPLQQRIHSALVTSSVA